MRVSSHMNFPTTTATTRGVVAPARVDGCRSCYAAMTLTKPP